MEWSLRCDRCWLFAWSSSVMSLASSLSQGSKMNELAAWTSWVYKLWGEMCDGGTCGRMEASRARCSQEVKKRKHLPIQL